MLHIRNVLIIKINRENYCHTFTNLYTCKYLTPKLKGLLVVKKTPNNCSDTFEIFSKVAKCLLCIRGPTILSSEQYTVSFEVGDHDILLLTHLDLLVSSAY